MACQSTTFAKNMWLAEMYNYAFVSETVFSLKNVEKIAVKMHACNYFQCFSIKKIRRFSEKNGNAKGVANV